MIERQSVESRKRMLLSHGIDQEFAKRRNEGFEILTEEQRREIKNASPERARYLIGQFMRNIPAAQRKPMLPVTEAELEDLLKRLTDTRARSSNHIKFPPARRTPNAHACSANATPRFGNGSAIRCVCFLLARILSAIARFKITLRGFRRDEKRTGPALARGMEARVAKSLPRRARGLRRRLVGRPALVT